MMVPITVMAISETMRMIPRTLKTGLACLSQGSVVKRIRPQISGIAGMPYMRENLSRISAHTIR